jgi:predicted permease
MRDWEHYVRGHLSLLELSRERESRMVGELASQLEEFYLDAIARGMTDAEADAHARAQITDWRGLADTLTAVDRTRGRGRGRWPGPGPGLADRSRWPLAADLWRDIRYASRRLGARPGFTLASLLTLGLGIGLCCLLFAFLNGLILQPLPGAREPGRLVSLQAQVSYPYFEQYRDNSRIASSVAAFIGPVPFNISRDGERNDGGTGTQTERIFGHVVSPEYFETLGVEPLLGRLFTAKATSASTSTSVSASESAVVVSERFWRTRLNADPAAIGRTLRINGGHATIIGVAPKDFLGVFPITPADVFLPITANPALAPELAGDVLTSPTSTPFRVVFRLAPGQTFASALEAITTQTRQLDERYGQPDPTRSSSTRSTSTGASSAISGSAGSAAADSGTMGSGSRQTLRPRVQLLAAGGLLPTPPELRTIPLVFYGVLIALILTFTCANLAGLMLAQGDARRREIAVRLSLGASRARLVRQLSSESLLLAIGGGLAGFAAAYALLALLVRAVSGAQSFATVLRLTPDLRVALVTFAISALAGMLFGLIPALAATRPDVMRGLRDTAALSGGSGGGGVARYRRFGVRNLFIVYQMTAATALTVVVGFMVAGVLRSATVDLGVDPDRAWLFSLDLARDGYTREEARTFLLGLPDRLATLNGVERVSFSDDVPFNTALTSTPVSVTAADGREAIHAVTLQRIGPGYFATLGIPMLRGSELTDDQLRTRIGVPPQGNVPANASPNPAEPALLPVVINQTAARQLFGDRDPLGAIIRQDQRLLQVVGVARYGKPRIFANEPPPMLMLPLTAADVVPGPPQGVTILIRSRAAGIGIALAALTAALAQTPPRASVAPASASTAAGAAAPGSASVFNLRTLREANTQMDRGVQYGTALYSILGAFAIGLASIGLAGVTAQAVVRRRKEIGIRMALGAQRWSVLRLVMREAIIMVSIGVTLGIFTAMLLGRVLTAMNTEFNRTMALGVGGNPLLVLAAPLLLMLVAIVTSYLPARRSSTIDPLITLREE